MDEGVREAISPANEINFGNLTDDQALFENLHIYARFCEKFNLPVPEMAQMLVRAIGMGNQGRCSVLVYDYVNAIPHYPPVLNGIRAPLLGAGRICNMICYKGHLFGVAVFPQSDNVIFNFPEFSSYNGQVQKLIFSYGNKVLKYCPENGLIFDFKPVIEQLRDPPPSILLTATLQRKLSSVQESQNVMILNHAEAADVVRQLTINTSSPQAEYIQID